MKRIQLIIILGLLTVTNSVFPQIQALPQDQKKLQMAHEGCQKPIGYFPTPSKLMCLLTAFGKSEKDMKAKALALVFSVCQGHTFQPLPAGVTPKRYGNLGACLSDPTAISLINKELTSQGFQPIKVVNSTVVVAVSKKE